MRRGTTRTALCFVLPTALLFACGQSSDEAASHVVTVECPRYAIPGASNCAPALSTRARLPASDLLC